MVEGSDHTRRVILVDDDASTRRVLARMMRHAGLDVEEAPGAATALELIAARPPDAVVTDLRMPGLDGVELVQRLKETAPGLPVVVMTASGEITSAVRAMKAGAADYLTKPIELEELLLSLDRAIAHARVDADAHGLRWQREITAALIDAGLNVESILAALARHTAEAIGDMCSLRLLSDDRTTLLPGALHHVDPRAKALVEIALGRPLPAEAGTVGDVLRSCKTVLYQALPDDIERWAASSEMREYLERFGVRSVLLAPLVLRGEALGILVCLRGPRDGRGPYGERDVTLVRDLSDRAALAIENARLYGKLQGQIEQTDKVEASLRKAEERLAQSQRIEALGRLAGGVAHDFNNVLSVVLGYADLLLEEEPLPETARAKVEGILKAARHGAALTGQLLAFGRQQALEPRVADLNEIVRSMVGMLQSSLDSRIKVALDLATDLHPVKVDPAKIGQVVMNLLINARDSMPNGGRVTIRTGNEAPPDSSGAAPKRPHAMIAITDTGTGMDAATSSRIFEPFFTTKAVGKGTGLGLSTVLGIVQQSEGHISVDSTVGEGSTFKVYLPEARSTPMPKSSRPHIRVPRGPQTILLVDDDDDVRVLTARILERGGFQVLAASTPAQARSLAADSAADIALLLTDIVMPGVTGIELARELEVGRPAMRVIYMSGYAQHAITILGDLPDGCAFLQKPIARENLLAKVRAELSPPPSSDPRA